jgi:outer membrane protein assembly factor BamB
MSTEDFVTRLGAELHAAALREERRGTLGSRLATLRYVMPRGAAVAAGALAALLIAAVIALGGLDWGAKDTVTTPKVIRTFTLAGDLGTMGTGFGSVWAVDAAQGQILRVDPETGRVQQRIAAAKAAVLNVGAGGVWVLRPNGPTGDPREGARLLRIDPSDGRVTSRVALRTPTGARFSPVDVVFADRAPWVMGGEGALRIDPDTGRPDRLVATRPADGEPFPIWTAVDDKDLWVLTRDQRIVRYDLESGRRGEPIPMTLANARTLTPSPRGPVLTANGEAALASSDDGRLVWRTAIGTGAVGPPKIEGDTAIFHTSGGPGGRDQLLALDLETGKVRWAVPLPEFGIVGAATVGRQIWLATPSGKIVVVQR